jgi:hypothetical protein
MGKRLLLALLLVACRRDLPECKRTCATKMGGNPQMCLDMCTKPCPELAKTYGVSLEQCRELQSGKQR